MPSHDGLAARKAALVMLEKVLRQGRTLDLAASHRSGLPPADHMLAVAIAGETLRRIPDLDDLIDSATRKPLPDDSKARMVLRLALAQAIALRVPDHAVVATALPLVDGGPRRLVHGVLGTLLRRGLSAIDRPRLPAAVEFRWQRAWGDDMVTAARQAIGRRPPLDLAFADDDQATAFVEQTGAVRLAPRHARLAEGGSVTALPGFDAGGWWVQDIAASLPARLIPASARTVLDCCAAPGGKTLQLAAAGHRVTALDRSGQRLERVRDNLARTRLEAKLIEADALDYRPPDAFDAILLDAPCSATGTFRRNPEVLHRAAPRVIRDSADLQGRLLDRAATWLRPGGTLVYSVCSLEPEEGEEVVRAFLSRHPQMRIDRPADDQSIAGLKPAGEGWFRLLPGMLADAGGLDGFFVARLVHHGD